MLLTFYFSYTSFFSTFWVIYLLWSNRIFFAWRLILKNTVEQWGSPWMWMISSKLLHLVFQTKFPSCYLHCFIHSFLILFIHFLFRLSSFHFSQIFYDIFQATFNFFFISINTTKKSGITYHKNSHLKWALHTNIYIQKVSVTYEYLHTDSIQYINRHYI